VIDNILIYTEKLGTLGGSVTGR